ncbi:MAG: trypsin-like peptidase domain-containing protein [Vicinamibacterales bacterium]|nr:trypsin-like peptidase domain-containing protein [Vicinamibacterales bacterium]
MTRGLAWLTAGLTATIGFLVGLIVSGTLAPAVPVTAVLPEARPAPAGVTRVDAPLPVAAGLISFADAADRLNPAVVNIDASARTRRGRAAEGRPGREGSEESFRGRGLAPPRGAGTGFLIDAEGHILTNHHVVEGAERITVKLADGRSLRGRVVGSDPDTDIAVLKVDAPAPLPHATLGDSDGLRVGEWVCAIGNPLAYEHTVTVGVVSFIGRKLFDSSLDNYIQTDAAINFGNSGGPLINARGEVIGINSAISRQASSIGFAIPINQAREILPQLIADGRVSRGYLGVALRDLDPDLQESLDLEPASGAVVQDVTDGSPGARAGLRAYDLITAVDGQPVSSNDHLIRQIAARAPGSAVRVDYVRDGRPRMLTVKLAERPVRTTREAPPGRPEPSRQPFGPGELGMTLVELGEANVGRFNVPGPVTGLLVQRVEELSAAAEGGIERGHVILEVNRQAVSTVVELRRVLSSAPPGGVLLFYLYVPELDQRSLRTVRLDPE